MQAPLHIHEVAEIHQTIVEKCAWNENRTSLKSILQRTANQLPLLISVRKDSNDSNQSSEQTILFFDRTVSKKMLFTPLRPVENYKSFEIYPKYCTFAITDLFRGIFEFVRDGQRRSRVFSNLEALTSFSRKCQCMTIFMSRDHIQTYELNTNGNRWIKKDYPPGSLFHASRIHRSSTSSNPDQPSDNDYLECLDEDSVPIYLSMSRPGRFSLIATSIEQYDKHRDTFLFSTQTPNVAQLIKRFMSSSQNSKADCIRLVLGPLPCYFHCQYLQFVREHTHDILVGLTQEGLLVEWNLESEISCRYAKNLNDVLSKLSGSPEERNLEAYIDQARTNYREHFQHNMQLVSASDWTSFLQFWKWTGQATLGPNDEKDLQTQSRRRFHLVTSIQDLCDYAQTLVLAANQWFNGNAVPTTEPSTTRSKGKGESGAKHSSFLAHMAQLVLAPHTTGRTRISSHSARTISLFNPQVPKPFDESVYDSNAVVSRLPRRSPRSRDARRTE